MAIFRSILGVLVGLIVLTVASFAIEAAADPILMHMFPNALPNRAALDENLSASIFLFFYTSLCLVLGAYVAAWIAGRAPVLHALIMGAIEVVLTLMAMVHFSNLPKRNFIVTIIFTIPVACIGGALRARHSRVRPA
ncbi:MAG TPA: hypothetical protein VEJ38_15405 [Candidatus Acidoferrales bacterium]|nr:hypothetical protein [Candidatus Acidoferrales bacterium]